MGLHFLSSKRAWRESSNTHEQQILVYGILMCCRKGQDSSEVGAGLISACITFTMSPCAAFDSLGTVVGSWIAGPGSPSGLLKLRCKEHHFIFAWWRIDWKSESLCCSLVFLANNRKLDRCSWPESKYYSTYFLVLVKAKGGKFPQWNLHIPGKLCSQTRNLASESSADSSW